MLKSKSGIYLRYIAALSFFLIFFDQILISALMVGLALFIEKNEWLSRQTLQAFFLKLFSEFIFKLTSGFQYGGNFFTDSFHYLTGISNLFSFLSACYAIVLLIFTILGIIRTLKEQDAGIPFFSGLSYKMFGLVKPSYIPPQPNYYYPPQGANPGYPPQQSNPNVPTGYPNQSTVPDVQPQQAQPPISNDSADSSSDSSI